MDRVPPAERAARTSLAVGLLVLLLKGGAWWLSGSTALLADALETVVQLAAAGAALAAVRYAARPADENHPYGHAKVEYVSAVLEGALILAVALLILLEAWGALLEPRVPERLGPALSLAVLATAINLVWAIALRRRAARLSSPALAADARYLMADVVTSVGVVLGVWLAGATGLLWLDPLLAAMMAGVVLVSGLGLLRASLGGLMDEAVAPEAMAEIRRVVSAAAEGAIEAHDLRTRRAGRQVFVEFHLVVRGDMTVSEAHAICDEVEAGLRAALGPETAVSIHVEPEGKAKHHGVLVP